MFSAIELAERGLVPDAMVRTGIRRLLNVRLRQCEGDSAELAWADFQTFLKEMDASPLAINTHDANQQHYEVPTEFYSLCLGPRKKYSSCYFKSGHEPLGEAEEKMLAITCDRARLENGQDVLELGCGWGSLSIWMAEKYPASIFTVLSNSATQRQYIESVCVERGLTNLEVITCNINDFSTGRRFDRVVSVEMFEHMRNWRVLFDKISEWLNPAGKLFFHIFVHQFYTYPFETKGEDDWMGKHFFTGGMMPAFDLPLLFQSKLQIENRWVVNGTHYGQTAELWLRNLDLNRERALEIFQKNQNNEPASVVVNRWRIFFMACAELWNYREGREWFVGHYLFSKR